MITAPSTTVLPRQHSALGAAAANENRDFSMQSFRSEGGAVREREQGNMCHQVYLVQDTQRAFSGTARERHGGAREASRSVFTRNGGTRSRTVPGITDEINKPYLVQNSTWHTPSNAFNSLRAVIVSYGGRSALDSEQFCPQSGTAVLRPRRVEGLQFRFGGGFLGI